jgi:hypothetical protein
MIVKIITTFAQDLGPASELGIPLVNADQGTLSAILSTLFVITGSLSVIFVVWGGFRYVVSGGNPEETSKAKNTILYSIIGLVISIFAVTIVSFVAGRFR